MLRVFIVRCLMPMRRCYISAMRRADAATLRYRAMRRMRKRMVMRVFALICAALCARRYALFYTTRALTLYEVRTIIIAPRWLPRRLRRHTFDDAPWCLPPAMALYWRYLFFTAIQECADSYVLFHAHLFCCCLCLILLLMPCYVALPWCLLWWCACRLMPAWCWCLLSTRFDSAFCLCSYVDFAAHVCYMHAWARHARTMPPERAMAFICLRLCLLLRLYALCAMIFFITFISARCYATIDICHYAAGAMLMFTPLRLLLQIHMSFATSCYLCRWYSYAICSFFFAQRWCHAFHDFSFMLALTPPRLRYCCLSLIHYYWCFCLMPDAPEALFMLLMPLYHYAVICRVAAPMRAVRAFHIACLSRHVMPTTFARDIFRAARSVASPRLLRWAIARTYFALHYAHFLPPPSPSTPRCLSRALFTLFYYARLRGASMFLDSICLRRYITLFFSYTAHMPLLQRTLYMFHAMRLCHERYATYMPFPFSLIRYSLLMPRYYLQRTLSPCYLLIYFVFAAYAAADIIHIRLSLIWYSLIVSHVFDAICHTPPCSCA